MDKISIIIPVYNVSAYIRKCISSVLAQTHDNLEILLINDGSTDGSGEICDEYAKMDKRVRVFHQSNKGVSSARNVGLKNLTGQYVGFVDSDDWIEPNMYELLHKAVKSKNVQVGVCSYFKDTDNESVPIINRNAIPDEVIPTKDLLTYPLKRDYYMGFCGTLWNKLFSANVIKKSEVSFHKETKYGEDILFYSNLVIKEKCTGTYVDKPLYHWYQRKTSASKSRSSNMRIGILSVYKDVEKILNNNGYLQDSFWARGFYCYHASVAAEIALDNGDERVLSWMQDEINEHLSDYVKTNKEFPEKFERINNLLNAKLLGKEKAII